MFSDLLDSSIGLLENTTSAQAPCFRVPPLWPWSPQCWTLPFVSPIALSSPWIDSSPPLPTRSLSRHPAPRRFSQTTRPNNCTFGDTGFPHFPSHISPFSFRIITLSFSSEDSYPPNPRLSSQFSPLPRAARIMPFFILLFFLENTFEELF